MRSSSSSKSNVIGSLKRGDSVTLGLVLSGGEQTWCEVIYQGPPPLSGFVPCGQLHREPVKSEPNYVAASPLASGAARIRPDAAIAEALQLSGMSQTLEELGNPALYMSAMPRKNLTAEQLAEVRQIVMQSMRPEKFQQAVTASLMSAYPTEQYPQLLDMLRSPLSKQMTAIELQGSHIDPKALQSFVGGLKEKPPDAQHMAIIHRIDQATGSSQLMVDIVTAVLEGMASGGQLSAAETRKMTDDIRGQRGDTLRQAALVRLLYQYRAVPDDQLNAYAAMLSSPAMVRFNQVAATGMLDATRHAAEEMMGTMIRRFQIKMPQPQQ